LLKLGALKRTAAIAFACVLGAGCASRSAPPLTAQDLSKPWTLLYVPHGSGVERVLETPHGFQALSREFVGDGKAPSGVNSYLYQSSDGVRWRLIHLERRREVFGLRGIAYGTGRWVMVGSGFGRNEIWSSRDASTWQKTSFDLARGDLADVVFAGERFFAFSTDQVHLTSTDGESWTELFLPILQPNGVAYGNGRYVVGGVGPILWSDDGLRWTGRAPDCRLPNACVTDPSGGVHPGPFSKLVFADRFYVDQLVSEDGSSWQAHSQPIAEVYAGGYLLGRATARARMGLYPEPAEREELLAWKPGAPPVHIQITRRNPPTAAQGTSGAPLPSEIDASLPGRQNCVSHRCIVIDQSLYLVP
jgi:hypothetical protein